MTETRLLCIGAHPDDCEFQSSGLAALVAGGGGNVRFISATDGRAGHHQLSAEELVPIRLAEAREGAAAVGAKAVNLGFEDGALYPDRPLREAIISQVREFEPDVVVCPRPNDYHPDHRAVGVAVQDAGYLLMVPNILPDVPVPSRRPVILYMSDRFTHPAPFVPDIVVDLASVADRKIAAVFAHRSQIYEWLPAINGFVHDVPEQEPARTDYLRARELGKLRDEARWYQDAFIARFGRSVEFGEAYQISEYGAPASSQDVYDILGV